MTILNDKISSYAIEKGFELNSAYALPVPETGTAANSTASDWSTSAGSIVYEPTVGPYNGGGSWKFSSTVATGLSRIRNTNTTMLSVVNDRGFTAGLWVNISKIPASSTTNAMPIAQIANANTAGFGFFLAGSQEATVPNQFSFSTDNPSNPVVPSGVTCSTNEWYFLSVIQDGTSTKYYVNGIETNSLTRTLTTNATLFIIGSAVVPTSTATETTMNVSNAFIAPHNVVTATDLLAIYNEGYQSDLKEKINSYAIEKGISFDCGYALPPRETGSIPQSISTNWNKVGRNPVWEPTVSPYNSYGSWKFQIDGSNGCRLRNENSGLVSTVNDNDFSTGLWVKFPTLPSLGTDVRKFHTVTPEETKGFSFGITGNSGSNNFVFGISTIPDIITSTTVQANTWYYLALRRTSNTWTAYLNGQLVLTKTHSSSDSTAGYSIFGDTSTAYTMTYNLSNFYMAPFATIDSTAITEIWNAGQPTSATITETPATASALMVEPTIAVTAGDHVEITTSILVSATFPSNIAVSGQINTNIVISETLTALAELINNVTVSSGTDESFSAAEFTASAELIEPFVSRAPMNASATMPGGVAVVDTNYYSLVKSLNPYLYIYDGKSTTTTNDGYQAGTFTKDLNLRILQDLGNPLNLVAEGKSWLGPVGASNGKFEFTTATNAESFDELVSNGTFAWEAWIKPNSLPYYLSDSTLYFVDGPVTFAMFPQTQIDFSPPYIPPKVKFQIKTGTNTYQTFEINTSATPLAPNTWAHIVVQSYDDGTSGKRRAELWINGSRYITEQYTYSNWSSDTSISTIFGSNHITSFGTPIKTFSGQGIDEVAIYAQSLTNSQIINHYNFISTLSPNVSYGASPMYVDIESGDHSVLAVDNVTISETPVTATALFVDPLVVAVKNISISTGPLIASAQNTDVTVYWGWTIIAEPATASAEAKEGFALNTTYYDYVIANINPYRYATFDTATPYADYGIDNDYSVIPTSVGGTIVNPDLGINGKSAKTAGTSYVTDGVILKESEWNDSWGTGVNSYHSAFWFQRASDDASTTGLRVLWNLNGYKDNQHVVLYQYQNKLHIQFNNGSGTFVEQDTVSSIDLFDYNRHFVVINFNHTNPVNNIVTVYVDAVSVMTIDLGAYTGETTNASSADSGPNDEANNHPRLGVGCLITPFAATALPVAPANTKLIIDEVYWDKNSIASAMVTNLYNVMPDKTNTDFFSEPFLASANIVQPALSIGINKLVNDCEASALFEDASVYAEFNNTIASDPLNASALMGDVQRRDNALVVADVFVATAIFDSPGLVFTVPADPMIASVELANRSGRFVTDNTGYGITVSTNGRTYPLFSFSPYMRYLRIVARNQKIYKDMEIL